LRDTSTNKITSKSGEIAERLVTNALRAQFSKEVDKLGVAGLAVELRKEKSTYGVARFRVSLIRKPSTRVGDVLSEGEHRCVALAAFLAELATTEGRSGIVFDDPVSSLDHLCREAVADRMADEGQHRQVIVFTHDIAFLFLLDQACREKGTHIAFRSVSRGDEFAGFCQQDPPARAQPVEKVIEGMQKQLDNEKILYERGDNPGWEKTVDGLQKRLRATWERAVEEVVGPVVKRLSNKVDTKGLSKLTAVTIQDCTEMRKAYGRCSELLHSSAESLNPPLPKPQAVQDEITALSNWVEDIKQRQSQIDAL
jgi:ATPase subunit of ABC transporter with duplicated ATPase domains